MKRFLGHLVQRSLTTQVSVRPRPVSIFEATQSSREPDGMSGFPLEVGLDATAATKPAKAEQKLDDTFVHAVDNEPPTAAKPSHSKPQPLRNAVEGASHSDASDHTINKQISRTSTTQTIRSDVSVRDTVNRYEKPEPAIRDRHLQREQNETKSSAGRLNKPRSQPLHLEGTLAEGRPLVDESYTRMHTPLLLAKPPTLAELRQSNLNERSTTEKMQAVDTSQTSSRRHSGDDDSPAVNAILTPRLNKQPVEPALLQATQEPVEPIVNITIGRVEVRAVTAPAPQNKRHTSSKPSLSLSDYLNQRGDRR